MDKPFNTRMGWTTQIIRNGDTKQIQPYGPYLGGLITAHPVGYLVVGAMAFIALTRMPEARWFALGAIGLGVPLGIALWLRHR